MSDRPRRMCDPLLADDRIDLADRDRYTIHVAKMEGCDPHISVVPGSVSQVAARTIKAIGENVREVGRAYPIGERDWPVMLAYESTVTLDSGFVGRWLHRFVRPVEPWVRLEDDPTPEEVRQREVDDADDAGAERYEDPGDV